VTTTHRPAWERVRSIRSDLRDDEPEAAVTPIEGRKRAPETMEKRQEVRCRSHNNENFQRRKGVLLCSIGIARR
jgi:hypothetical protein